MIYFDHAATTELSGSVLDAMMPYLRDWYGNPGSLYALGRRSATAVENARNQVASFFHTKPENIIFTSGGSEGNNMVLRSFAYFHPHSGIASSLTAHDSAFFAAYGNVHYAGSVSLLHPDEHGVIGVETIERDTMGNTGLVAIELVNNETGVQQDAVGIGRYCATRGISFFSDCVQAAGTIPLDVEEMQLDYATISSHKIHGPKGVGALYARDPSSLVPLVHGGDNQEWGLRGGTENVAGIVGFGQACAEAEKEMGQRLLQVCSIKQGFCRFLCESFGVNRLQEAGISDNFGSMLSAGKILSLSVDGVYAQTLVLMLDTMGICISAGSACHAHAETPSRVLTACGFSDGKARSTVRLSFDASNTMEEAESAAYAMHGCIETLRKAKA